MTQPNFPIRSECHADRSSIWDLNQSAFGGDTEANLVDSLRSGGFVDVSLVAVIDERIVGHILFSTVSILTEAGPVRALSLAPTAVLRSHQRQGIGSTLVEAGLQVCRDEGHRIAVVLGHPEFYPRFGFSAEFARPLDSPFGAGDAWMAMELESGALNGVCGSVEYPPPFSDLT